MLSKVIRRQDLATDVPVAWRRVGAPPAGAQPPTPGRSNPDPAPAPDEPTSLRRRISELEGALERSVREAREAGRREGEVQGRQQAAAELQAVIERLGATVRDLANFRDRFRRESEGDLVKLSLAIARRIIHRELAVDPESMLGLLGAAFDKLKRQEISRLRVHPSHKAPLERALAASAGIPSVEVAGDPSLEPGAAIFETARGDLDASVSTQLEEIGRGLADRLAMHP